MTAVSASIFIGIACYIRIKTGMFQRVGFATFPPRIYYLSYGIFVSYLLMIVFEKLDLKKQYSSKFVRFVSDNSLWIYLWHIFALWAFDKTPLYSLWYAELAAVFISSILITLAQRKVVNFLRKKKNLEIFRYL